MISAPPGRRSATSSTVSSPWRVFATTSDPGMDTSLAVRSAPPLCLLHRGVHDRLQKPAVRPGPLFLRNDPNPHRAILPGGPCEPDRAEKRIVLGRRNDGART